MNKKVIYRVLIVILLILGYFNYFANEKEIEDKREEIIETKGAVYDSKGYHIESQVQKDFLEKKETTFEKVEALIKNMTMVGDNAILDSNDNLLLKSNIFGKSVNGWEIEADELRYNKADEIIKTETGLTARNLEKKLELYGKNFESDINMENVILTDDVRIKISEIELMSDKAVYSEEKNEVASEGPTKIVQINESGIKIIDGEFQKIKYDTKAKEITTNDKFEISYNNAKLYGNSLLLNEETEAFVIKDNAYIIAGDFKIYFDKIISDGGDLVEIIGKNKIHGENGVYYFEMDKAIYNKITKKLDMIGNIKIKDADGGILLADSGVFSTDIEVLELFSNKQVTYKSPKNNLKTKELKYFVKEEKINLYGNYKYIGEDYFSSGEELEYAFKTESGQISNGEIGQKSTKYLISGNSIKFDRSKDEYSVVGNAHLENGKYVFESKDIYQEGNPKVINLPNKFKITVKESKDTFQGENGIYEMEKEYLVSNGEVKYVTSSNIITGKNLTFDKKTGIGNIEKDIIITNENNDMEIVTNSIEFKENEYVKSDNKIFMKMDGMDILSNSANYNMEKGKIYFPGEILLEKEIDGINGKMYDGEYNVKIKELSGKNFNGNDGKVVLKSGIIKYYTENSDFILEKNAEIKDERGNLASDKIRYNRISEIAKIEKPFKFVTAEYTLDGKSGVLNRKTGISEIKNPFIKMENKYELKADRSKGNLEKMEVEFFQNISGNIITEKNKIDVEANYMKIFGKKLPDNKTEIEKLIARDRVKIVESNNEFYSDDLKFVVNTNELKGYRNNKIITKDETGVVSAKSDFIKGNLETEIVDLEKNVKIIRSESKENLNMTSKKAQLRNKEKLFIAEKDVLLKTEEITMTAEKIIYNSVTNKVNASGNVFVEYEKNELEKN